VRVSAADPDGVLHLKLSSGKELALRCWRNEDDPARMDVIGPHNHKVRSIVSDSGPSGWLVLAWDGKDDSGNPVDAGHYYVRPSRKGDQVILDLVVKN